MSKNKPVVVVTRKLPQVVETRMMELFQTKLNATDQAMSKADLIEAVKTADVLVPTVTDRIDKSVILQAGPRLKLIANFGNGVDNIDVETALSRGITVTNTPGVLDQKGDLITGITPKQIDDMVADGTLSGGMLPKIGSALDAARNGVKGVHIIDGRVEHALLLEVLTNEGVGTMIRADDPAPARA